MGIPRRKQLKITSAIIVETIFFQLITLTCGSLISSSNLDTPLNISTTLSQNTSKHVTITDQEFKTIQSMEESPKCTISKDESTYLKNQIEKLHSLSSGGCNSSTCILNSNDLDNCKEFIKVIQCGVQHLKDNFIVIVTSGNEDSIDEILNWMNLYENLLESYQKNSENLKQGLPQDNELELEKLQADLQNGIALNKALNRLQTTATNICVSEIMHDKTKEAAGHFQALKSVSIATIIKQSYTFQNNADELKNFHRIIYFLRFQQYQNITAKIPNDVIAYETLYSEMKLKNHLNSLKVIILAWGIQNSPAKDKLTSLYSKVEYHLNKIAVSWANIIYNNWYDEELTNFAKTWYFYFNEILSDTLKKVLKMPNASNEKFDNILTFIRELPYISESGVAFSTLLNEIKKQGLLNNFAIVNKLAHKVKEYMEMPNYPNVDEKFKKMFDDVKYNLPSWSKLIWEDSNKCKIRNRIGDQYLYVEGEGFEYDSLRRRVFSGQADFLNGIMEAESQWKFETEDEGESFMIKNVHWNEYLYADINAYAYDKKRRQVFTWRPKTKGSQGSWEITPTGNGTYINIQSIHNNYEYLYVDNGNVKNNLTRRVFTWRLGKPNTKDFSPGDNEWELLCDVNTVK